MILDLNWLEQMHKCFIKYVHHFLHYCDQFCPFLWIIFLVCHFFCFNSTEMHCIIVTIIVDQHSQTPKILLKLFVSTYKRQLIIIVSHEIRFEFCIAKAKFVGKSLFNSTKMNNYLPVCTFQAVN